MRNTGKGLQLGLRGCIQLFVGFRQGLVGLLQFLRSFLHPLLERLDELFVGSNGIIGLNQIGAGRDEGFQKVDIVLGVSTRLVGNPHHADQLIRSFGPAVFDGTLEKGDSQKVIEGRMSFGDATG